MEPPNLLLTIETLKRVARRVPVLGRLITALVVVLSAFGLLHDDSQPEPLTEIEKRARRKTRRESQARYVIKASDAMQCVEDYLYGGTGLVGALATALRLGLSVPDVATDAIFTCIESKVLRQTSKRVRETKPWIHRPSKGHGKGRPRVK